MLKRLFQSAVLIFLTTSMILLDSNPVKAIDLTQGIWTIVGSDDAGNVWDGSTINFETQIVNGSDYVLSGFFEWTGNSGSFFGRENFNGTLSSSTNLMTLSGFEIVQPSNNIVTGDYQIELALTGNDLINGIWGGPGTIPSRAWSATRQLAIAVSDPNRPDVNGDGRADLVWWNSSTGQIVVWFLNADGTVSSAGFPGGAPSPWEQVAVADVNGDNRADLVWWNSSTGQAVVWFLNADGTVSAAGFPGGAPSPWELADVADVNGDNRADLVWWNSVTGQVVAWFLSADGSVSLAGFPGGAPNPWELQEVADVNGDNRSDLVWWNSSTGQVVVWFLNADGSVSSAGFPGGAPNPWQVAEVADANGDNRADLVWWNSATGQVVVWFLNADGTVSAAGFPGGAPSPWELADVADVNGDNRADLVWWNSATGQVVAWFLNADGSVSAAGFPGGAAAPWAIGGGVANTNTSGSFSLFPPAYFTNYNAFASLAGTDNFGATYTGSISEKTLASSTFSGLPSIPLQTNTQFTISNGGFGAALLNNHYSPDVSNRRFLGVNGDITSTAVTTTAIPETATIGDSGTIGTYVDSNGFETTLSWRLDDGQNGNAKLVFLNMTHKPSGILDNTFTTTYLIEPNGNRISVELVTFNVNVNIQVTLNGTY